MARRRPVLEAKERAVALTAQRIDEVGEPEVRLRELAETIGVAQVTLLRWFGNLEVLLNEANVLRMDQVEGSIDGGLASAIERAQRPADITDALDAALLHAVSDQGRSQRAILANVLSIAQGRPKLAEATFSRLALQRQQLAAAIAQAQQRGLLPSDFDADVVAALIRANLFGLLLIDLHPPLTDAASKQVVVELRNALYLTLLRSPALTPPLPEVRLGAVHEAPLSGEFELDSLGATMVDIAVDLIDQQFEQNVRITQVVERSGVNVSQLHRRFGDFQSLLVLAQARRMVGFLQRDLKSLASFPTEGDRPLLTSFVQAVGQDAIGGARRSSRLRRLNALGSSFQRSQLRAVAAGSHASFAREHGHTLTTLATHYDLKVSAYTLAIWTSVNIFGLVLADVEPDPLDPQGFVSVINDTWLSMMRLHPRVNVPELTEPLQASEITEEPLPSALPAMVPSSPRNETSEAIIAAATLLLRREGVAGTSTVRVAQVADVSDATVGYYFRSREQLFIEVFERAAAERLALLAVLLAKMPHDANAAAELLIAWHLADATDPDRAGIWRQLRALAAAEAALAARIEEHDHAFADLVLEGLGVAPTPAGFDVQGVGEGTSGAVSATGQTLRALVLRLQVLVLGLQVMAPTMGRRAVELDALHGWVRSDLIAALAEAIREATSP